MDMNTEQKQDDGAAPQVEPAPSPDTQDVKHPPEGDVEQTALSAPETLEALSQQIGNECYAAYSYHAAAGWCHGRGLDGFAAWAARQGMDEIGHAMRIYRHMLDAGAAIALPPITAPVMDYAGVGQLCAAILQHEKGVTDDWRTIYALAMATMDGTTAGLALDFLKEQLEEEDKAKTLLQKVRMADNAGILVLDNALKVA